MNLFLLILFFFIIYSICNFSSNENFTNTYKIGLIIPTTSKKRDYKKVEDIDFFKVFMKNFLKTYDDKYNFTIYLGYDDDDKFYLENIDDIKNHFNIITENKNVNLKMKKLSGLGGKLGKIWSKLAQDAFDDNCDYLYQIGDDVMIINSKWEDEFIKKLQSMKNIGVVGPYDINNSSILTQSFVHKSHLKIFKTYFPVEIINWYIDDWITKVYKPNNSHRIDSQKVKNMVNVRYKIVNNKKNLKKILKRDKAKFNKYLSIEGFEDLIFQKSIHQGRIAVQNYMNNNF
jgi:hypothetical protein